MNEKIFNNQGELNKYKEKYFTENILFNEIGPAAKSRGHLTFNEFITICLWKTPRAKNLYKENKEAEVIELTKKAFLEPNETKKIRILRDLNGVGIPVASAILTVVFPEKYGVIDVRCIQTLKENGYNEQFPNSSLSEKDWTKYTIILDTLSQQFHCNAREVEMAIFAKNRCEHPENLYANAKQSRKIERMRGLP